MHIFSKIINIVRQVLSYKDTLSKIQQSIGRIEARQISYSFDVFNDNEFQVYSQWGDDGLIQHLIHAVNIKRKIFIEFGVENYTESNTRFLLVNNNWSGLVIDGSEQNIEYIKKDPIYWKYNLKAEFGFITKDNINNIIDNAGIVGDIGLLSIDIDGNDYWVWKDIHTVNPCIVVCEYNSLWGYKKSLTIPYQEDFIRTKSHYSNLYYGASIKALTDLANSKGYSLIGSNIAGNNAYFVRNDLLGKLRVISAECAWIKSQFNESRDSLGKLTHLPFEIRLKEIAELPLVNLEIGQEFKIKEIFDIN